MRFFCCKIINAPLVGRDVVDFPARVSLPRPFGTFRGSRSRHYKVAEDQDLLLLTAVLSRRRNTLQYRFPPTLAGAVYPRLFAFGLQSFASADTRFTKLRLVPLTGAAMADTLEQVRTFTLA